MDESTFITAVMVCSKEKDNTGENAEVPEGNVQSEDEISTRTRILSNVSRIWIKNVPFAFEPTGISLATKMIRDALTRQQPKETPDTAISSQQTQIKD